MILVLNAAEWSASSPGHFTLGERACINHRLVTVCTVFLVIELVTFTYALRSDLDMVEPYHFLFTDD
jgi:hypothetical protein